MQLIDHLRAATRDAHDRIERLPAAQAMARGQIDKADYADLLGRLFWVHTLFEQEVGRHWNLAVVWPAEAVRAAAVFADLTALGATAPADPPPAVLAWADRLGASGDPATWAGAGYVLEGSRMGGRVLVGPVARGLGVAVAPGVGLDYHLEGIADLGPRWGRVRAALAALDTSPRPRDALVFGAVATFDVMAAAHTLPARGPGVPRDRRIVMRKIALHPVAETTLVETGGTLLSALLRKDMKVLMSCGGKGLCSTCHVWVKQGADQLSIPATREKRTLSLVADARPESRLACQCRVYGDGVEVEVPEGMYIESADDLVALLGTAAGQNILHPVTAAVLIPKGKIITRSMLIQSRGVDADLKRVRDAGASDSSTHRAFTASGVNLPPASNRLSGKTVADPFKLSGSTYQVKRPVLPPQPSGPVSPPPPRPVVPPPPAASTRVPPPSPRQAPTPLSTHHPAARSTRVTEVTGRPAAEAPPDPKKTPLQPGAQVGKYLLIECIGKGGVGMVYRALHTKLKTPVAVKFLRPEVLSDQATAVARFTREAQLLAQIVHPNVVRVLDYEDDPRRPFVVMEYVDGLSAAELLRQCGRVAPDRAVGIALDVIDGLDAARKLGVVHRDVKPANILLPRDGPSKLVDLGLALLTHPGEAADQTNREAVEGTIAYMAPEQAMGDAVDHRADQYSLGCTLYQLLTGQLPFNGRTAAEMMLLHMRQPPAPPHEVATGVPPDLSRVVLTTLEKSPADRYPDYAALRADLQAVLRSVFARAD